MIRLVDDFERFAARNAERNTVVRLYRRPRASLLNVALGFAFAVVVAALAVGVLAVIRAF